MNNDLEKIITRISIVYDWIQNSKLTWSDYYWTSLNIRKWLEHIRNVSGLDFEIKKEMNSPNKYVSIE